MADGGIEFTSGGLGVAPPTGAYSQLAVHHTTGLAAVAGQSARDEHGHVVGRGDAEVQGAQALRNLGAVLLSGGLSWASVLSCTTFVVGRERVLPFLRARETYFADVLPDGPYPPNTLVVVAGLTDEQMLVEIQALAVGPGR